MFIIKDWGGDVGRRIAVYIFIIQKMAMKKLENCSKYFREHLKVLQRSFKHAIYFSAFKYIKMDLSTVSPPHWGSTQSLIFP